MNTSDDAFVDCYSGHTYAQEPRTFVFVSERRVVTRMCKRWREPAGPRFKVLADDGATYVLAYDEATDQWHVSVVRASAQLRCSASHNNYTKQEDDQR